MNVSLQILLVLITYLWGSIPYGYILIKLFLGENILNYGSGNVGSTNVRRMAGKKLAVITQLLDMIKGLLPVALFLYFKDELNATPYFIYVLALTAIMGHNLSVFLKFKGGKGVNTTLGASLLLAPQAVLISVVLYYLIKWRFKYVSLGSIVIAIALPLVEFIFHGINPAFYYLLLCSLLILIRHRKNIERLWHKNELPS